MHFYALFEGSCQGYPVTLGWVTQKRVNIRMVVDAYHKYKYMAL